MGGGMTGIIEVTDAEYHADPCEVPSLNQTVANLLLTKSPRHAWAAHPKLGGAPRKTTKAMDRGTLIHAVVLGGREIWTVDAENWKTKAAQQQRDEAIARNAIPVLLHEIEDAQAAANEITRQLACQGIALDGRSEVSIAWTEEAFDGSVVQCRGRVDHVKPGVVYDLKTCADASPFALARHCARYGYHVQAEAYRRGVAAIQGEQPDYVWIFAEVEPVVTVTVARPSAMMRDLGERQWMRAVDAWTVCLAADVWPAYADEAIEIDAPEWASREVA